MQQNSNSKQRHWRLQPVCQERRSIQVLSKTAAVINSIASEPSGNTMRRQWVDIFYLKQSKVQFTRHYKNIQIYYTQTKRSLKPRSSLRKSTFHELLFGSLVYYSLACT